MTTSVTVTTTEHPARVTTTSYSTASGPNGAGDNTSSQTTTVANLDVPPNSSRQFNVADTQVLSGVLELPVPYTPPAPGTTAPGTRVR